MAPLPFIPREEIERRAAEVLSRMGIVRAPIDPVEIAIQEGLEVFSIDLADESVCGILRKENGKFCIYTNQDHPRTRRRYTVAHELGHYYLHGEYFSAFVDKEVNLYRSDSPDEDVNRMEVQANMFAAALLMPENILREEYEKFPDISHLSRLFLVSRSAMGHRIHNVGL